ncbi:hypothetical protein KY349_04025 [Candidatus Woesearchaeota archaeon]|jgi:hypothetical protein|nr:hypothetical protein [Candidatus Woesearchaeota archaeon]
MTDETSDPIDKVKEELDSYAAKIKETMTKAVMMNIELAQTVKNYTEDFAVHARDLSLSFLPEKLQQHVINMNKEALRAIIAVLEEGVNTLERPGNKEEASASETPEKTESAS